MALLDDFFDSMIDIPRMKHGVRQSISSLINEETQVIFPVHPRTKKYLRNSELKFQDLKLKIIDPVPYLDMLLLEKHARVILTDSGGVQKEAYWLKVPCITLRDETEWIETVASGWNTVVGTNPDLIKKAVEEAHSERDIRNFYGDGNASTSIANILSSKLKR